MALPADYHATLQHPWHRRLYHVSAAVTLILLVVATAALVLLATGRLYLSDVSGPLHRLLTTAIALAIVVPGFLGFVRVLAAARPPLEGAVVGPGQFPEIRAIAAEYAAITEQQIPTIVVAAGSRPHGTCRSLFGRHVIVLHSDLIESNRASERNYAVARFELARQMGLLVSGEREFKAQFFTLVPSTIPYLSRILARSEDYTADRWGAYLAPDAAEAYFAFKAVGKVLWPAVSASELVESIERAGVSHLMNTWFMEAPPLPWRVAGVWDTGVFDARRLPELLAANPAPGGEDGKRRAEGEASGSRREKWRGEVMDFSHVANFWTRPEPVTTQDGEEKDARRGE